MPMIRPIGRPATWAVICAPSRARRVNPLHQPLPARGIPRVRSVGRNETGRPVSFDSRVIQANSASSSTKSLFMPKAPRADRGHRLAYPVKLGPLGEMAGNKIAGIGLVRIGARGGEAERAGAHRRFGQPAHLGDVLGRRGLAIDAALPHHEYPERVVRHLRTDIDGARHAVERVEIFREAFPLPVQAFGERAPRYVLDRLHQIDQAGAMLRPDRREADPAIAEEDRRDTMPGGRGEHRVPGRLAVVMRMDIDPAGRDQQTMRVDLALRRAGLAADLGDLGAVNRHVAGKACRAGTVEDGAAANDDVMHLASPAISNKA